MTCVVILGELVSSQYEAAWLASRRHRHLYFLNCISHVPSRNTILHCGFSFSFSFCFSEWPNLKYSVLSQSMGLVLVWVSPEANHGPRIHTHVAFVGGVPANTSGGVGKWGRKGETWDRQWAEASSECALRRTGPFLQLSKAAVSFWRWGIFLVTKRWFDMTGKPPNLESGCQRTEQERWIHRELWWRMSHLLLIFVTFSAINSRGSHHRWNLVTTQYLCNTSLAMKLDARCFRSLFLPLSV